MARGCWLVTLLLVTAGLAGCVGGEDAPTEATSTDPDGTGSTAVEEGSTARGSAGQAVELGRNDTVEGPSWQVGQWFGYHIFFGPNDTEGFHYDSAVVEDTGDAWLLAPANRTLSKLEAMWDLPVLGSFSKQDLSTTQDGEPFAWYDWPLFHNKTWTDTTQLFGDELKLTFNVTYDPSISTADGSHPGFSIRGITEGGERYIDYDYVPHLGWFGHLYLYEIDGEVDEDPPWYLHVMTMGAGMNWTGTAYVDHPTPLIEHFNGMAPPFFVEPNPHASFTVSSEATHILGFAWSSAYTGAHETMLVDPEDNVRHFEAIAPPMSSAAQGQIILQPAIAGQWEVVTAGAGQWAGGGVSLIETVEEAYVMEDGRRVEE